MRKCFFARYPVLDVIPEQRSLFMLQVVEIGKGCKVKYELDKSSGMIKVSSAGFLVNCPTLVKPGF